MEFPERFECGSYVKKKVRESNKDMHAGESKWRLYAGKMETLVYEWMCLNVRFRVILVTV